ncbi:MAG: Anaerobic nitric oxide reductase transcription regulator NorR [Desulfovibrio sp.]
MGTLYQKEHKIAILWSGSINKLNVLQRENVEIFQNVGVDDVQPIIGGLDFSEVSAVIGAPGIAAEIRQLIPVPLVIAYPNYIDVLETVKDVELNTGYQNRKFALILHEGNKIQEDRLDYFINNTVVLYKYDSKPRMRQIFQKIMGMDYELIIGGPTAVNMARSFGVQAVQLMYREQAIVDALEKTKEILFLMDKELRESERLKAAIDVMPDGIIETDENGVIVRCNRHSVEILGLSLDQILGRKVTDLVDPRWEEVYRDRTVQVDRLFTYKKARYFSTRLPIIEGDHIIGSVGTMQEAAKIQTMESKVRSLQTRGLVARYGFKDIVSESPVMQEVIERAKIYARCDSTILLEGETGTGKEIFAQSIHNDSPRKNGPFVAINCAALTETLLESELMGYEEGAFTGARKGGKTGLFENAHKGTIFLDEINQLSPPLQAKLLRVIQEKAVRRVGGDSVIPVDVRIITATNENLKDKIATQTFRSDLYYRINVLNICLPPLRERREDIPRLMAAFASALYGGEAEAQTHVENMCRLVGGYDWPGNIRELQNFVERYGILRHRLSRLDRHFFSEFQDAYPAAGVVSGGTPAVGPGGAAGKEDGIISVRLDTLDHMESALIRAVVDRCGGNKSKAALVMNISRNTIHQKLKGGAP